MADVEHEHTTDSAGAPVFSFVLPAFNEAPMLERMTQRLVAVGESLGDSFEILWVNDGSSDGTESVLETLSTQDPRVRALHFSRNFGHMAALTAGLEHARATGAVVCLDADGQHPPECIPEMVSRWRAGADLVQAIRTQTAGESFFKRTTSRVFYKLINSLADLRLREGSADFRLMDRQAVDVLNGLPERERFVRGLVQWIGFRCEYFDYAAAPREAGKTKYSVYKMLAFALSGITSFSIRPLRLSFLIGLLLTIGAFCYAVYILFCYMKGYPLVPGWTSMLLVVLTVSGVHLMVLGITSEYLARLYVEQKHRPIYILRDRRPRSPGHVRR